MCFESTHFPEQTTRRAHRRHLEQRLIAHHGFSEHDIHQLTVYVVGPQQNLRDAWVAVTERFEGNVPPATLLGVALLGYVDQLVEVDAIVERLPKP